ncbi:MAG: serine/threonine-protein kinase [Gemmatimonadaceae bacterium]|nr:serine/threonine-protein kinase [Gemmatimonadaceae bacterium]
MSSELEALLRRALADRYEVEGLIGRGGMATVYRARDLRHSRWVALKVLDRELGAVLGAERFLAEIRVTANLQHPNILPLFDSGEADGVLFYVTPFIDGESLRTRLEHERQLPVDEAVQLAVGVAGALQYAHKQGVIHRDLKPENILLLEGQPLLGDFGIALAVSNAGGARVTQTGLSLGTPQYMSPEQATADRLVDARSDIYSLAAVLYEMLTGEAPHTGGTAQAIIARVVTERPRPVRKVRDSVPLHVAAAIEKALAKIPADRFGSAQEFAEALQGRGAYAHAVVAGAHANGDTTAAVPVSRPRWRDPVVLALGAITLVSTIAALTARRQNPREAIVHTPVRFALDFPVGAAPVNGFGATYALSPDGRQIVYAGRKGNESVLYVRSTDQLEPHAIEGTQGAMHAAFSEDGRWLAFTTRTELRKIPIAGGTASTLTADLRGALGITWVHSDRIILSMGGALVSVPATGGDPTPLFVAAPAGTSRAWPRALGDDMIAFAEWGRDSLELSRLWVGNVRTGVVTPLKLAGAYPLGMIEGEFVYGAAGGRLMAVSLDETMSRVTGEAAPVLEGVQVGPANGVRAALSSSGTLLYVRGSRDRELVELGPGGEVTPLKLRAGAYMHPRLSPDGRHLAVVVATGNAGVTPMEELRVYDLSNGAATIVANGQRISQPTWRRDGRTLAYGTGARDSAVIWERAIDASAPATVVTTRRGFMANSVVSPDGKWVIFGRPPSGKDQGGLFYAATRGDTTPKLLMPSNGSPISVRFSADGQRIAYASDESGQMQVYVRDFPGPGGAVQVSTDGGTQPVWSGDGQRLYYRNGNAVLETAFAPGRSVVLRTRTVVAADDAAIGNLSDLEASIAGTRVIASRDAGTGPSVVIVHDWWGELRRQLRIQRTR